MDYLKQLYINGLNPMTDIPAPTDEEYDSAVREMNEAEEALVKTLPPDILEAFRKYDELRRRYEDMEAAELFAYAMRLGAKLALALLTEDTKIHEQ